MDQQQFVDLINQHKGTIHKVCNTYCRSFSRPDLVQEIIAEVWESLGKFKKNCSFNTWLYAVARNVCIDVLRKHNKRPNIVGLEAYAEQLVEANNAPEMVKQLREAMRYNTVLDTIEEPYRTLFEMYLEGFSYEEISRQTGVNQNNLRQYIHRIKQRLYLRYGKVNDIK